VDPPPSRLALSRALLWVVVGGIGAQLASVLASGVVRGFLSARGVSREALDGSALVIVPAMVASASWLVAVALLAPLSSGLAVTRALGLRGARPACFVAAAIGTIALGPAADRLMGLMDHYFPELSLGVVPALHELVRSLPVATTLAVFALLPGLSEELLFRGVLQQAAGNGARAIVISALGFAIFHVDPHHVAGVLPLGLFLAWVAARCGTLVTIVAHVANNAAAIGALHSTTFDVGYGSDRPMPWQWLPISLLVAAACATFIALATPRPSEPSAF
jgi:membrane protease YdiL (CAAX protease family)